MENQFKKVMSERSDEQLIEIVTTDREKYNEEALNAAEIEIDNRNLDKSKFHQISEELSFISNEKRKTESNTASLWLRFFNYLIDIFATYLLTFLIGVILIILMPDDFIFPQIGYTILLVFSFFGYYILMEVIFQKTIGKFITKTKVVTATGEKPKEHDIILRTICRFIPFEPISFFINTNGFHDNLSKTKVIKDKEKNNTNANNGYHK